MYQHGATSGVTREPHEDRTGVASTDHCRSHERPGHRLATGAITAVGAPGGFIAVGPMSHNMSTETDGPGEGERMEKIDVRVPAALLEEIEAEYERRGYTSRSEAIRDALRDWVDPPVTLSEEALEALAVSRAQRERGETVSADEVRDRLGLND